MTPAEVDRLAGVLAEVAAAWAGGDPARLEEAAQIIGQTPALPGRRLRPCGTAAAFARHWAAGLRGDDIDPRCWAAHRAQVAKAARKRRAELKRRGLPRDARITLDPRRTA